MYLHTLRLWNFRKYGIVGDSFEKAKPGLEVTFNKGLNVLVGENDSGKTAIIDAIKLVLLTQSKEYVSLEGEDFYQAQGKPRATELKIECIFKGFSDAEAGNFLEWAGFENDDKGTPEYVLSVRLIARNKENKITFDVKAGQDDEGSQLDGNARELLRVTYLKPLRDADAELTPGRRSRLSQIFASHKTFQKNSPADKHKLEECFKEANDKIKSFFDTAKQAGAPDNTSGKELVDNINGFIDQFFDPESKRKAYIDLSNVELIDILRKLSLNLENNKSGLGSLNLLFIATELLLLQKMATSELKLALIEEIEAHLHPQAQLRLIKYLETEIEKSGGQFILTTHSTILASEIKLSHLILCQNDAVFPMSSSYTMLSTENYEFLERFLDATKSNLFFAKGVIFVEGDAENLLFPTIAELIDCHLHKHGVSIVNVGSKAFLSYANIFKRKNELKMTAPVAVVTDMDVPPFEYSSQENSGHKTVYSLSAENITHINGIADFTRINLSPLTAKLFSSHDALIKEVKRHNTGRLPNGLKEELNNYSRNVVQGDIAVFRSQREQTVKTEYEKDNVKAFVSKVWTMEFDIALSELKVELHQAILWAKSPYSSIEEIEEEAAADFTSWNTKSAEEIAYEIYKPLLNKTVSKAATAQYFARILNKKCKVPTEKTRIQTCINTDENWKYIRESIKHATKKA